MHIDDIRTTNNFFTTKQIFHHDWLNWSASWVRIAAVVIFGISCSKKRLRKTLVLRDYPTWTAEDLRNEWSFFFTINANEGLNFPYKTSWRRRRSHKVHKDHLFMKFPPKSLTIQWWEFLLLQPCKIVMKCQVLFNHPLRKLNLYIVKKNRILTPATSD